MRWVTSNVQERHRIAVYARTQRREVKVAGLYVVHPAVTRNRAPRGPERRAGAAGSEPRRAARRSATYIHRDRRRRFVSCARRSDGRVVRAPRRFRRGSVALAALAALAPELARSHRLLPLMFDRERLIVLTDDPSDSAALNAPNFSTQHPVEAVLEAEVNASRAASPQSRVPSRTQQR